MERGLDTLVRFVERARNAPALWDRLLADPLGTVRTEDVAVDARDVKALFGIAGATDHELLAVLAAHLRRLDAARAPGLLDACEAYLFPGGLPPEEPRPRPIGTGRPLGLLPSAEVPAARLAALEQLDEYDLSPIEEYLATETALPTVWITDAIFEFRRYLGIRYVCERSFAMFSEQVDEVWHTCLLFTELYADICQPIFGTLAHHDPWDDPKPEQIAVLWDRFATAYRALYGEPSYLWTLRLPPGAPWPTVSPELAAAASLDTEHG